MKSRGCYETPGGTILLKAHRAIESLTLDREVAHLKDDLMPRYASLIYNGYWWSPERQALQALIDHTQRAVNGWVRVKLYKGNVIVVGRDSKTDSLFDPTIATFEDDAGAYDQKDAAGFIKLNALRMRIAANLAAQERLSMSQFDNVPWSRRPTSISTASASATPSSSPTARARPLGVIFPSTLTFNTGAPEIMEIVAGPCRIRLKGRATGRPTAPARASRCPATPPSTSRRWKPSLRLPFRLNRGRPPCLLSTSLRKSNMVALKNAVDVAGRQVGNRYDFKGTSAKVELNEKDKADHRLRRFRVPGRPGQGHPVPRDGEEGAREHQAARHRQAVETISGNKAKQELKVKFGIEAEDWRRRSSS